MIAKLFQWAQASGMDYFSCMQFPQVQKDKKTIKNTLEIKFLVTDRLTTYEHIFSCVPEDETLKDIFDKLTPNTYHQRMFIEFFSGEIKEEDDLDFL